MCCDNNGAEGQPNGVCEDCGEPTVDGETKEHCNYSPVDCQTCGLARCNQSC